MYHTGFRRTHHDIEPLPIPVILASVFMIFFAKFKFKTIPPKWAYLDGCENVHTFKKCPFWGNATTDHLMSVVQPSTTNLFGHTARVSCVSKMCVIRRSASPFVLYLSLRNNYIELRSLENSFYERFLSTSFLKLHLVKAMWIWRSFSYMNPDKHLTALKLQKGHETGEQELIS